MYNCQKSATFNLLCELRQQLVEAGFDPESLQWGLWWEADYYAV
jgi:hypothetical protein